MKSCKGYNLLEMLVALLVISIGLLGVATLQTRGQQFNYFAYMRIEFVVCNRDKELRLEGRKIVVKSTGSVSVERSVDYQCTL